MLLYFFKTPYRICLRVLANYPSSQVQYGYGETIYTSVFPILEKVQLNQMDRFYELGCGRGRLAFFVQNIFGCQVVGIDLVPEFINTANQLAKKYSLKNIQFLQTNIMAYDYTEASVVYVYGTEFSIEARENLLKALNTLKPGARIISVTHPLHTLAHSQELEALGQYRMWFTWGKTPVYVYKIKSKINNHSDEPNISAIETQ